MNTPKPLMDEVKLLPCPFCGANEEGFRLGKTGCPKVEELSDEGGWRVTCYTCRYYLCWEPFPTREAAIIAWNTRPTLVTDEVVERVARAIDPHAFNDPTGDSYAEARIIRAFERARAAIAAMPAMPPQSFGDHALPPSGLSE